MKLSLPKWPIRKKSAALLLLGALGILLVLIGTAGGKTKNEKTEENGERKTDSLAYIEALENKISTITKQITGSNDVSVLVYVESGTEYIYVSDEKKNGDQTSREYVTVRTEDGAGELILKREVFPKINGVSIACKGGDTPSVQAKLIGVLSTALGLSSNRICIVGTKT